MEKTDKLNYVSIITIKLLIRATYEFKLKVLFQKPNLYKRNVERYESILTKELNDVFQKPLSLNTNEFLKVTVLELNEKSSEITAIVISNSARIIRLLGDYSYKNKLYKTIQTGNIKYLSSLDFFLDIEDTPPSSEKVYSGVLKIYENNNLVKSLNIPLSKVVHSKVDIISLLYENRISLIILCLFVLAMFQLNSTRNIKSSIDTVKATVDNNNRRIDTIESINLKAEEVYRLTSENLDVILNRFNLNDE